MENHHFSMGISSFQEWDSKRFMEPTPVEGMPGLLHGPGDHGEPWGTMRGTIRDWGLNMEDTPKLHRITSTWLGNTEKMLEHHHSPSFFWRCFTAHNSSDASLKHKNHPNEAFVESLVGYWRK